MKTLKVYENNRYITKNYNDPIKAYQVGESGVIRYATVERDEVPAWATETREMPDGVCDDFLFSWQAPHVCQHCSHMIGEHKNYTAGR